MMASGKDTWEYKIFYANQAALTDKLSDVPGGLSVRLAAELFTNKVIGKATRDAADIHAPKVTEYMRLQPLVTAMLAKIEIKSSRYHDFRAALLADNVGAELDMVEHFLPKTGNPIIAPLREL